MPATAQRLADFLDWLREGGGGFEAADQQFLAAQDLIELLASRGRWPAREDEWCTLLAPILCSSANQQERFYELFQTWFATTPSQPAEISISAATQSGPIRRRAALFRVAAAAIILLGVFSAIWAWQSAQRQKRPANKHQQGDVSQNPLPPPEKINPLSIRPSRVSLTVRLPSGGPLSGAIAYYGGKTARTDDNGHATLDYAGVASAKYLLIAHSGFHPILDPLPSTDSSQAMVLDERFQMEGLTAWVSAHHDLLRLGTIALPALLFLLWGIHLWRQALELRKWTTPTEPRMRQLGVSIAGAPLFKGSDMRKLAIGLRRRRAELSPDLDPERTAQQTSHNGGYFSPVSCNRSAEPDYLLIGERKNLRDHQARLHDELIRRLRDHDVAIQRYYFQSDPRVCTDFKGGAYSPAEIAAVHPHHEVWLALDATRCVNPITGAPEKWWSSLSQWRYRVLLSSTPPEVDLDIRVTEPSRHGLEALFLDSPIPREDRHYPSLLADHPERWLNRASPAPAAVARLIAQLSRYLQRPGYLLLQACAVYPAIAWNVTATLAGELLPNDDVESTLDRLSALPWFRHGMMPDWLRVTLIRNLGDHEAKVRKALRKYIEASNEALRRKEETLDIVPVRRAAVAKDGAMTDYVYLSFIRGKKLDQLSVEAPRRWRRFLSDSLWLRALIVLAPMLVIAVGGAFGVTWLRDRLAEKSRVEKKLAAAGRPQGEFAARMFDVAEASEQSANHKAASVRVCSEIASDLLGRPDPWELYPAFSGAPGVKEHKPDTDFRPQVGFLVSSSGRLSMIKSLHSDRVGVFNEPEQIRLSQIDLITDLSALSRFDDPASIAAAEARFSALTALTQAGTSILRGRTLLVDDAGRSTPVASVEIRLAETRAVARSDVNGWFQIPLPKSLQPGDPITIMAAKPGWAIWKETLIPQGMLTIKLLPKGSKRFLTVQQIQHLLEDAVEKTKLKPGAADLADPPPVDLNSLIADSAAKYGLSPDEAKVQVTNWAAEAKPSERDPYTLGLAAFAGRDLKKAAELFSESAQNSQRALESLENSKGEIDAKRSELLLKAVSSYERAGDAYKIMNAFPEAVTSYQKALSLTDRQSHPQYWADEETKLGAAYAAQGARSPGERGRQFLTQAVSAYRGALAVQTRELSPQAWVRTQVNLGAALAEEAYRTNSDEAYQLLAEAVSAYRAALEVQTRAQSPQDWAQTQASLGTVLAQAAWHSPGDAGRELSAQAASAYRAALEVQTREQLPQEWASTYTNLGSVLALEGTRSEGEESRVLLTQAVTAYRTSLEVQTREQHPQDWATTEARLGAAFYGLAQRTPEPQRTPLLDEATTSTLLALQVLTENTSAVQWRDAMTTLARVYELKGDRSNAIKSYQALLQHDPNNPEFNQRIRELTEKR